MTVARPILDYGSSKTTYRTLTLDETGGRVIVTFAAPPTWAYIVPIVTCAIAGLAQLFQGIFILRGIGQLYYRLGPTPPTQITTLFHAETKIIVAAAIFTSLCWATAAYHWIKFRRWGRAPRVLIADDRGLIVQRPGWWNMRERKYPATEISGIELRPMWGNLTPKRTVSKMYIHRRNARRVRFVLSSWDSQLPSQIATRLAAAFKCPLN
jgi:hypothetical protein